MHNIAATNVNKAFSIGLQYILNVGVLQPSRNGDVLVAPTPVTTTYVRPWERVLFSPMRDANPFFHLMESLWMLAGREDLEFVRRFNYKFGAYSDDGKKIRGAYGYRWRNWFGYDQLTVIVEELQRDPLSRRAVLAMWDGSDVPVESLRECYNHDSPNLAVHGDLLATTVDKPCNTHIYFRVNGGKLDMTVCCRSNDILWGAYGANAVHMSVLQEYMAAAIGVEIGRYYQISNNYHLYTGVELVNTPGKIQLLLEDGWAHDYYTLVGCNHFPLVKNANEFLHEVEDFLANPEATYFTEPFIKMVAQPMYAAWWLRKTGNGLRAANEIVAADWRKACEAWIERRAKKEENNGA